VKYDGYRLIVARDGESRAPVYPQRPRLVRPLSLDRQKRAEEPAQPILLLAASV
jgi:hypothetical protein